MAVDYRKVWKALGGTFLKDGSVDTDSVMVTHEDYKEVLDMLGCKVDEDCKDNIKSLSINMQANNIEIPSCEIRFKNYEYSRERDNPARIETAISYAIEQYGKEINSDLGICQDIAIVWMNFETEDDAKRFYELITEEYSELDKIWNVIYEHL